MSAARDLALQRSNESVLQDLDSMLADALAKVRLAAAIFEEEMQNECGPDDKAVARAFRSLADARLTLRAARRNELASVLHHERAKREQAEEPLSQ